MEIRNYKNLEPKFLPELKPLFEAMATGRIIKRVVCMNGTSSKDKPNQDIIFEDFIAESYHINDGNSDEVHINKHGIRKDGTQSKNNYFFMCWVRSFELCDYIEMPDGKNIEIDKALSA